MSLVKRKIDEIIKRETKKKEKNTLLENHLCQQKEIQKQKKSQEERKNSRGAPSLEKDSEEAKDMLNQEKRDAVKTNFHCLQK